MRSVANIPIPEPRRSDFQHDDNLSQLRYMHSQFDWYFIAVFG